MRLVITLILLMHTVPALANPYDGRMSMFENGKEVSKSYHQMLQETTEEGLSPLAKIIHRRVIAIFDDPNSSESKKLYLASFPRSFKSFIEIFHPKGFDQLYDGFIYIHLLGKLADEYPDLVGEIYLKLAGEACLDADAPNYLRHNLIVFESKHARLYKQFYETLSPEKRNNVEVFKRASLHDGGEGVCDF